MASLSEWNIPLALWQPKHSILHAVYVSVLLFNCKPSPNTIPLQLPTSSKRRKDKMKGRQMKKKKKKKGRKKMKIMKEKGRHGNNGKAASEKSGGWAVLSACLLPLFNSLPLPFLLMPISVKGDKWHREKNRSLISLCKQCENEQWWAWRGGMADAEQ